MRAWQLFACAAVVSTACQTSSDRAASEDARVRFEPAEAMLDAGGCADCPSAHDAGVDPTHLADGGDGSVDAPDAAQPTPPASTCEAHADGYYAIRSVLDVWWSGSAGQIDPGRGSVTVHALARRIAPSEEGELGTTRLKLCGVALPTFTMDATCRALQLDIAADTWEGDSSSWSEVESEAPIHEGDTLRWSELVSHVESVAEVRADAAEYIVPFDSEHCSNGMPYGFGRWPVTAGRGMSSPRSAARLELSLTVRASGDAVLANDCKCSASQLEDPLIELSVGSCESALAVTASQHEQNAHERCSPAELSQLEATLPELHALEVGEMPGAIDAPRAWTQQREPDRDIDRRISQGPRTHLVHLGDDRQNEPSCDDVRGVAFPRL
jgi:hypothetical protein